jgi:hypothetical protein
MGQGYVPPVSSPSIASVDGQLIKNPKIEVFGVERRIS